MTTYTKDKKTNSVKFYRNGMQVFDFSISGNVAFFENGDCILL